MGNFEEMCTLHAMIMLCSIFVTMLPDMFDDSFTGTRYFRPSQLCLLKRIRDFKGLFYFHRLELEIKG